MSPGNLKSSEKRAAEALASFLFQELGLKVTYEPGDDPPDCVFKVEHGSNTERWAVEETQLHQYIDWKGEAESRARIERSLERLAGRIRANAKPAPKKDYAITLFGPIEDRLQDIEAAALQYIENGATDEQSLDSEGLAKIVSFTRPAQIGYMIGLSPGTRAANAASLASDIEANVQFALDRILGAKLPRLANLAGYSRKILIISKGYMFADVDNVSEHLRKKGLIREHVDSVLLVDEEAKVHWVSDPGGLFGI